MSFKVQFDISSLRKLSETARLAAFDVLRNKAFQDEIAQSVIKDIQGVTRSGRSVVTNQRFPKLSESWIQTRKKIIAYQGSPPYVSARKSNLSLSGQLLDSLTYRTKNRNDISSLTIDFSFSGKRKPYRYQGSRGVVNLNSRLSNQELATILDKRFNFIGVRDKLQSQIIKRLIDFYLVTLRKLKKGG